MRADTTLVDGFVAPARSRRLALPRRSLRSAPDERLVAQIRGADGPAARTAFEVLFDRHHRGVLSFCRHMLGSPEEAEDALQHTFSAAYSSLLRDDRDIALRAWLYAIARNRCLSLLAARREQVALDDIDGLLPSTGGLALEVEQRSDLRELLVDIQRLPEEQRAALVLAQLEAHSHKEIAEILGVPVMRVKALVFQARETLMIRRRAREADCTQIREQLSVLRGGALRRRELRRHVDSCEGCRIFEAETRRQRAGIAILLPVAPTLALKNSTLGAAFGAITTSAAAGIGTISTGSAAAGIAVGTKAIGAKAVAVLALAGSAGGGGYLAVGEVREAHAPPPAQSELRRDPAASAPAPRSPQPAMAPTTASPPPAASTTAADRGAGSSSGAVSGPARAAGRSGARAAQRASGNSVAARSEAAARAARGAGKQRATGSKSAAAAPRASSKAGAKRVAAKAAERKPRRAALGTRPAGGLQEPQRRRDAGATRRAQEGETTRRLSRPRPSPTVSRAARAPRAARASPQHPL